MSQWGGFLGIASSDNTVAKNMSRLKRKGKCEQDGTLMTICPYRSKVFLFLFFRHYLFCNLHCLYNFKSTSTWKKCVFLNYSLCKGSGFCCFTVSSNKVIWNICEVFFFPIPSKCTARKGYMGKTHFLGGRRQTV